MSAKHAVVAALALLLAVTVAGCGSSQSSTNPAGGAGQSGQATPAQLGQQIFTTGGGSDGYPINVTSGAGGPCARCHGADAKGAVGPDIRWSVLTGGASSSHPPRFPLTNEAEFTKAVTNGDAAGNQLKQMMPHYQLTPAEVTALVAYLKTL